MSREPPAPPDVRPGTVLSFSLNYRYGCEMNRAVVLRLRRFRLRAVPIPTVAATAILLLCGACATPPVSKKPATAAEKAPAVEAKIVSAGPVRPKVDLTADMLYKFMVAEFAGQQGDLELSVKNYLELARQTRDPEVVERATRIAVFARDDEAATEGAKLWVELDPGDPDPQQVLAVMALRKGDMNGALDHLNTILDYSRGDKEQNLFLVANLLGREKDHDTVETLLDRLLATHGDSPPALYAFAHVAARIGDLDRSLTLLEKMLKLQPDNDDAAISYISILQRQGKTQEATEWLKSTLKERKDNDFNLRLAYARLLTDAKRYDDARRQFEILAVQAPNNTDVLYALGLLYLQDDRLDQAEMYFKRLVGKHEHSNDASYYLGRIAEQRKQYQAAADWYQGVERGDNLFDAQVRLALMIAKQGRLEDARTQLRSITPGDDQERTILVQAEAELLTDAGRLADAMDVYDKALKVGYNADLLYARAMLGEKMGRLDIVERDLRRIIAHDPDHAQALNALGYTLADRTTRYDEAYKLIKRALELSPGDFYVLDSMGWVLYRLGKMSEAVDYLRQAIKIRKDPEIAAHLGEVLWVKGDKDAARKVWDTALQEAPDDSVLLNVIKKFNP